MEVRQPIFSQARIVDICFKGLTIKQTSRALLLVAAIFFFQNARALDAGDFRFSFVLAPQLSWLNPEHQNVEPKGVMFGYNFGVMLDRFFGPNYALATGLMINTTGGKLGYRPVGSQQVFNYSYHLKYIEIPVGLKLRSGDLRRTNIYGRFGLTNQFNIQARDENGLNINDNVKFLDLGYHLGGGIEYSVGGRNALMIGILFNNGFTDVTKTRHGINDKSILNRFVFEFGFIF